MRFSLRYEQVPYIDSSICALTEFLIQSSTPNIRNTTFVDSFQLHFIHFIINTSLNALMLLTPSQHNINPLISPLLFLPLVPPLILPVIPPPPCSSPYPSPRTDRVQRYMHLHFIREGDGYAEAYFARYLVEDRANFPGGALSYTGRSDDKLLRANLKKNCGVVLYCVVLFCYSTQLWSKNEQHTLSTSSLTLKCPFVPPYVLVLSEYFSLVNKQISGMPQTETAVRGPSQIDRAQSNIPVKWIARSEKLQGSCQIITTFVISELNGSVVCNRKNPHTDDHIKYSFFYFLVTHTYIHIHTHQHIHI